VRGPDRGRTEAKTMAAGPAAVISSWLASTPEASGPTKSGRGVLGASGGSAHEGTPTSGGRETNLTIRPRPGPAAGKARGGSTQRRPGNTSSATPVTTFAALPNLHRFFWPGRPRGQRRYGNPRGRPDPRREGDASSRVQRLRASPGGPAPPLIAPPERQRCPAPGGSGRNGRGSP
jgi:hypothetical protein